MYALHLYTYFLSQLGVCILVYKFAGGTVSGSFIGPIDIEWILGFKRCGGLNSKAY